MGVRIPLPELMRIFVAGVLTATSITSSLSALIVNNYRAACILGIAFVGLSALWAFEVNKLQKD